MVLNFKIEILSEQILECRCSRACLSIISVHEMMSDDSAGTRGKGHKSCGMALEELDVDPWFVIESFGVTCADEFCKISIPFKIFCEEDEMMVNPSAFPFFHALGVDLLVEAGSLCDDI